MKKFLAIYHDSAEAQQQFAQASEAETAAVMQQWMTWKTNHEANVVDFGAPVMPGTLLGGATATPTLSGYSVLQAESLEALKAACADHPHPHIELLECVDM